MRKLIVIALLLIMANICFAQSLQKGCVLGLHEVTITLNANVTIDQFLDFYKNSYIPEYEKHFKGVKLFLIKGIRGENENNFGLLFMLDSIETRDRYWPEKDKPSELAQKAVQKLQSVLVERRELGSISGPHTDWLIL